MLHVNSRGTTFEHQRAAAAVVKAFCYILCCIQVDLKSFLASGAFFLGREATERATISQVISFRHSSFLTVNQETNTSMSPGDMNADVTLACERCCVTNGYLQRLVWDVNGFS